MAVYKIFPSQDAAIYSDYPSMNAGLDPVLDLSNGVSSISSSMAAVSRILVKFSEVDLYNVVNNFIGTASYSASLRLYLADATSLPSTASVEVHPVYEAWDMGVGYYLDSPASETGISWKYRSLNYPWSSSNFPPNVTASYQLSNPGGGTWYTSSVYVNFSPYDSKDLNLDVTSILSQSLQNGFIIKNSNSLEFNTGSSYSLSYYSRDTHTIYPPSLDIKWDDSVYLPDTSSSIISNSNAVLVFQNLKSTYSDISSQKIRLVPRDRYPQRFFTTSSLYTIKQYLPSSSFWSLIDHKTEDVVIDFDDNFTKISADQSGNYFTVHMYGLEPARYYRFLIKSYVAGETVVFDNNYIFKVE